MTARRSRPTPSHKPCAASAGRLAEALAFAHANGVLHCDIKPGNILLTPYGRPLLADFNVAFDRTRHAQTPQGTRYGGTLAYMAPEYHAVMMGQPGGCADERCDLYSLGVVLYELATGTRPRPVIPSTTAETLLPGGTATGPTDPRPPRAGRRTRGWRGCRANWPRCSAGAWTPTPPAATRRRRNWRRRWPARGACSRHSGRSRRRRESAGGWWPGRRRRSSWPACCRTSSRRSPRSSTTRSRCGSMRRNTGSSRCSSSLTT
ncbi:protein kinase domain-containing protein [Frigoriglobus tundricola]|uniref:protein kinase domain-containing protein n=1 Tax=Frigoriglobus tundricola TaxID=2774151 RepID=UPI0036F397F2